MTDARPRLRIEPLSTDRLDLTPLDPGRDATDLHIMLSDPAVHQYDTDARVSSSVAETESRLRLQVVANGGATWTIRLRAGPAIGTIGVFADQCTTIRGVGWNLARSRWQQGITGEAARTAIPYLLAQDGVDGLEAWTDSRNLPSIGVARAAGMTERARLPRVYDDHVAQTVVMVRAANPVDPEVFGVAPTLVVQDLAQTVRLIRRVLALHVAWEVPDPPTLAFLAVEPWSGSAGFRVLQASEPMPPGELHIEVGISVDLVRTRVLAAGLSVLDEPADQPWFRRQMAFLLPDGNVVRVSGPNSPAHAARFPAVWPPG